MIKDIVVHLTGSKEDEVHLAHAEAVARNFDAHLTGLFLNVLPEFMAVPDPAFVADLRSVTEESRRLADATGAALKARFEKIEVPHELRRIDSLASGAGRALAAEARTADLFVGTRPYGAPDGARIEEAVLFGSGRGCLLVPPGHQAPQSFERIFVGWKSTREAARAVAEALPLLKQAGEVLVGLVEEGGASEEQGIEPAGDIGRHLSRHGVSAELRTVGGWSNAGEALLNEAVRSGADLIVIGGYGRSRFREWLLGGVTRFVLSESAVPVLAAH